MSILHSPRSFAFSNTFNELFHLLKHNRYISVHFTTIFRELEHLGMSRKKLRQIASERNENLRLDFVRRMAEYPANYLGFLDETSKNDWTLSRGYGRAKKGSRAPKKEKFVRGTRLTATGLLTVDGIVANRVVEWSMKQADYLDFIEHEVVHPEFLLDAITFPILPRHVHRSNNQKMPLITPFPGPLSVLVMDNTRIHHGEEILELAERFRECLPFQRKHFVLTPQTQVAGSSFCPRTPPISIQSRRFSKIKAFIRRNSDMFAASIGAAVIFDMNLAMEIITAAEAEGYFMHAGYF
jgi:hypothetical protein